MQQLGDFMPITETEQMANTAADFKDTLGDLVRQPYIVSVSFLTEGLKNLEAAINVGSDDPEKQLSGINRQLQEATESLKKMQEASGKGLLGGGSVIDSLTGKSFNANQVAAQQKIVDDLIAQQQYLKGVTSDTGDVGSRRLIGNQRRRCCSRTIYRRSKTNCWQWKTRARAREPRRPILTR